MRRIASTLLLGGALAVASAFSVQAGTLVINANTSDPGPKQAFEELVERFEAANPDVDVELNPEAEEGGEPLEQVSEDEHFLSESS